MNFRLHIFRAIAVLIALFSVAPAVQADHATVYLAAVTASDPGKIVGQIFQFAFTVGALLAFGMVVWGGVKYVWAAGNPGIQSDARDQITQALLGLLLLIGAVAVLTMINPGFLNFQIGGLSALTLPSAPVVGSGASAFCTPVGSGDASTAALQDSCFGGAAEQASSIANAESRGIPTLESGVDKCKDGNAFSFGLFQINVIANADLVKDCQGIFDINKDPRVSGAQTQGKCLQYAGKICVQYDCAVSAGKEAQYATCKQEMITAANNIAVACAIFKRQGWNAWGANIRSCHF